jgi:hypothetical protein
MGTLPIRPADWNLARTEVQSLHFKVSLGGKPEECFAT